MVVRDHPYTEKEVSPGVFKREFDAEEAELVWHRDREDRTVELVRGCGWMLQMDNSLPVEIVAGEFYEIPAGVYHRLIKGDGVLTLRIRKRF
jgi:hypothetical protein